MADAPSVEGSPTTDDPSSSSTDLPTEVDNLKAEVAKWREMAKKSESLAKANLSAAEKLAKIEESSKSELEKAQARAADADARVAAAEERANRALMKAAVSAAASKAGAIDIDAVVALLPPDAVTVSADGDVVGIDAALKAMREAKPALFGKPKPAPGSADGGRQSDRPAQWTREDLKGKSTAQIEAARKAGLLASLTSGAAS